ncbi:MAG: FeoA family protein [Dethiobacteria bacterium]|jgi:ferrous iron transport protein A|nr:FeoA family protein [Bacillota bacterium]NMD33273.1 ferrous iron transport protein A [Bacillota bacterium]HOB29504.1 FeoA family protein [Bacillota bacterium]HPZ42204.1 FeoA family protein [Bacillota bacterium]HQD53053.1 FeoA family protein [Bacillota bacterium]
MKTGQSGRIKEIHGGRGMVARLQALGFYPGKKVTKLSAISQKGPVVVEIDRSRIALGYGRANRILVEVEE